jgi:hypothetical protein
MKMVDLRSFFVKDWSQSWRWLSVQFAALGVVWTTLPEDVKAYIPIEYQPYVATVIFLSILVGRYIDQKGPGDEKA